MAIGQMTQRVDLEYPAETRDDYGARSVTWVKKSTVWADVRVVPKGQEFDGERVLTKTQITIKTHFRTDVSTDWRVKWNSKYYQIRAIENQFNRNRFCVLTCEFGEAF